MRFSTTLILSILLATNAFSGIFPEERVDNWVILDTTGEGNHGSMVVGFANDEETKLVYECNYNLASGVKYAGVKLLFPESFPNNSTSAVITYKSDYDNATAVSQEVWGKEIVVTNLYLWKVLKKASKITFNTDIYAGKVLVFRQKKIDFKLLHFTELLEKANSYCMFK